MSDFRGKPLEHWLELRRSEDGETRWAALDALRHLLDGAELIAELRRSLLDPYDRVRALATHELFDLAVDNDSRQLARSCSDVLEQALFDPCRDVRLNAVYAIEALGAPGPRVMAVLKIVADCDDDGEVRAAAADAHELFATTGGAT